MSWVQRMLADDDRRPLHRMALAATALSMVVAACSSGPEVVAVVEGAPIGSEELDALHPEPGDLPPEERADSVFLLILHRLLVAEADADFAVVTDQAAIDDAFAERTRRFGDDVDTQLRERGITRDRVLLEAELDVIRARVETLLIERGEGFDLDAAYRQFISINSMACLVMLAPVSPAVEPDIAAFLENDVTLEEVERDLAHAVERVDLGCANPFRHPGPVQPVAVDGEPGKAYLREFSDGTLYVVAVLTRDAPALEEVMEEVLEIAASTQGSDLFDAWAVEILRTASVEVEASIGTWEPDADSNGIPTVVAPAS
jgi:hypothetical protein